MRRGSIHLAVLLMVLVPAVPGAAGAADDARVRAGARQLESGTRAISQGHIGDGVSETAKGIGNTVVEGARFTGEKVKESGRAAEPAARRAWRATRDGAVALGQTVKTFFTRLFSQ